MTSTHSIHPGADLQAVRLAPFSEAHLPGALRLSQEVSWPHRHADWALTLSASKGVVARAGEEIVGTALCTDFGPVSCLNMIIVDERMRGRGLGRRLMEAVMALAGDREMRLVATEEGLPLYEKLGFRTTGRIAQHQGIVQSGAAPGDTVRTGGAPDVARLAEMDRAASGQERARLLERIAADGEVLLADNGFAMLRAFGRGQVLGPVVAGDEATAKALIAEGARRCEGSFLRIDLTGSEGLGAFAAALGLASAGGGTAMTHAPRPQAPSYLKTFALVSQALG